MVARILASALLVCSVGFAQSLAVRPHLIVGDTFSIDISHARSDPSRPENNARAHNLNAVRVLETGPTGSLLEWIEGAAEYDDPAQAGNPIVEGASKALDNLRLLVMLGPDGEYVGLQNATEVTSQLQAVAETVMKNVSALVPEDQRAGISNVVRQVMQPAALLSSATRDIQMYFNLHGADVELGVPVEANLELPNPITGTAIPAKVKVVLESANNLSVDTTFDPEFVQTAMTQLLSQAAPGTQVPQVKIQDGGKYVFDSASGLMQSVSYTRKVQAGPQTRTDEWQLRLVNPPKR